jgi:hypothetical protein
LAAGAALALGAAAVVAVCFAAGCFVAGAVTGAVAVAAGGGAKFGGGLVCTLCAKASATPRPATSANTLTLSNATRLFGTAFRTVSFLAMIWLRAKEQKHRTPPKESAGAQSAQLTETKKPAFSRPFCNSLRQPLATTGALPIGALPAQPAALNRARMAVVAIRNFFIGRPPNCDGHRRTITRTFIEKLSQ